jgi:hypothetical protein
LVSFLDDLKRQAEAAKAQQQTDSASAERNTLLADIACKTAFTYLSTLAQQLEVLQPVSKSTYVLDKRHSFNGLRMGEFRVDARRKRVRDAEVFDHVALQCKLKSGQALAITKDFLPDIERLEPRLRQCGAQVNSEAVRNPANGKLLEMRYRLVADFVLTVRVSPDHERGRVRFQLANLDGLETVTVEFPAFEIGTARLDELARWLVGEPNDFLKGGQQLRRVEA